MLDFIDSNQSGTLDPHGIDERSDAELDACSFGVIGLDPDGVVLRYNLYESRLARLDRNQVVGRNFFLEIAPCTRNERFEGRFRAFVARGGVAPDGLSRIERFEYVFDFRFGAQDVSVDIVRGGASDRYYLLVNRRKISSPRPGVPSEQLAAAQASLAPSERDAGVLRDALERRYVDAPASLLAALRATCDRLAPESWRIFSLEWGTQWGRRVAIDLEAQSLEARGRSLRDLTMRELSSVATSYFADGGWGRPTFDLTDAAHGFVSIDVERSAIAEAAAKRRTEARPEGDLACHLLAGAFGSLLSSVAGRRLAAREIACSSGGAPRCSFIVLGHERREEVDAAIRAGTRGLEPMRGHLRGARTGSVP
jgi:photoactive yellow protein